MHVAQDTEDSRADSLKNWVRKYSEEEQATLLIVVGAILFLIPEPITSLIGAIVILVGAVTWFSDWIWG